MFKGNEDAWNCMFKGAAKKESQLYDRCYNFVSCANEDHHKMSYELNKKAQQKMQFKLIPPVSENEDMRKRILATVAAQKQQKLPQEEKVPVVEDEPIQETEKLVNLHGQGQGHKLQKHHKIHSVADHFISRKKIQIE